MIMAHIPKKILDKEVIDPYFRRLIRHLFPGFSPLLKDGYKSIAIHRTMITLAKLHPI